MPNPHSKLTEAEERELVRRVLNGDAQAGDDFVLQFRQRLYAVSVAVLGYKDPEAEDAVQETFIAALAGLKDFEFRSSLYTWLNQICVRQCYRRIQARSKTALGIENDLAETLGATAGSDDGALRQLDEERLAWLKKGIEALDSACKTLLELRDLKGESYGGVARALKVPIGTVMSRLSRCREKLKRMARNWQQGG